MQLYIATTNPGKLRDFAIAAAERVTINPLPGLKLIPAPPEDEPTFAANAILKARAYSLHAPSHIVLADDSGLEVDALNGAPGVRSARYAEDQNFHATSPGDRRLDPDERNNLCLLHALASQPNPNRQARYLCLLAAARDGELLATGEGSVAGEILPYPRGEDGFGYDPLFYLPELHRTMAQLDPVTRLSLSHRGRALQALLDNLLPNTLTP